MRLFLAIDLPADLRRELSAVTRRLRGTLGGWRWVRPEGIHLTLRFLGEVSPENDRALRETWRGAAASGAPLALRLEGIGAFPPRGMPRVLWIGVQETGGGSGLVRLAAAVEEAASAAGFPPERRPFRAHLTLARASHRERPEAPPADAVGTIGEMLASELVLFQSELLPGGARYTALEAFPLGGER